MTDSYGDRMSLRFTLPCSNTGFSPGPNLKSGDIRSRESVMDFGEATGTGCRQLRTETTYYHISMLDGNDHLGEKCEKSNVMRI